MHENAPSSPAEGQPKDPESLYRQEGAGLFRYLLGVLGNREEAEDAMQTIWIEMIGRWGSIESPVAYLWRTARHQALRQRRRGFLAMARDVLIGSQEENPLDMLPAETNPGLSHEDRLAMAQAVSKLPFEQREAVVLMAFEGRSAREAGERLGVTESTIDSRYRTALGTLRKKLARRKSQ